MMDYIRVQQTDVIGVAKGVTPWAMSAMGTSMGRQGAKLAGPTGIAIAAGTPTEDPIRVRVQLMSMNRCDEGLLRVVRTQQP